MEWFRTYHAILDKPKFARLPLEAIGAWLLFAAAACRSVPRGSLPTDVDELALLVRRPRETVEKMTEILLDDGLLERRKDGVIWLYKWEAYQPPSTDRATKSKGLQHSATSGNICNTRGEERRREENTPLKPPRGGKKGKSRISEITPTLVTQAVERLDGRKPA
jgi:hypothetical protein